MCKLMFTCPILSKFAIFQDMFAIFFCFSILILFGVNAGKTRGFVSK